jgi:hypothetical protein
MMKQPMIVLTRTTVALSEHTPLRDVLRWLVNEEKRLDATGEYQDKVRSESLARTRSVLSQNMREVKAPPFSLTGTPVRKTPSRKPNSKLNGKANGASSKRPRRSR